MDSSDLEQLLFMNTLGMAVLVDALKHASYYLTDSGAQGCRGQSISSGYKAECMESVAFIQGTGLDIMLIHYNMAYDADSLRRSFFTLFNGREFID